MLGICLISRTVSTEIDRRRRVGLESTHFSQANHWMSTVLACPVEEAATSRPKKVLSICLINPRFDPSYWGFEYALPLYPGDKRSTMTSGSLTTVAGLCGEHNVRLVDENVEEIDWESLQK